MKFQVTALALTLICILKNTRFHLGILNVRNFWHTLIGNNLPCSMRKWILYTDRECKRTSRTWEFWSWDVQADDILEEGGQGSLMREHQGSFLVLLFSEWVWEPHRVVGMGGVVQVEAAEPTGIRRSRMNWGLQVSNSEFSKACQCPCPPLPPPNSFGGKTDLQ